MTWNDVLDRLRSAGLNPVEEIYIDNYGNILPLEHPEFRGRFFRCARGVVNCGSSRIEVYLFPSESHREDFLEVIGGDAGWIAHQNVVLRLSQGDPAIMGSILQAISDIAD
jgi:hypothetical protein